MTTTDKLLDQIKAHAMANYNDGWDFIVECYTDDEILQECADNNWTKLSDWTSFYCEVVAVRQDRIDDAAIEGAW
jgi:hypothetical protein